MSSKFFLLFLFSAVTASPFDLPDESVNILPRNVEYRLPTGALEVSYYKIDLSFDENIFTNLAFNGNAYITFNNLKATREIKLHANGLNILQLSLVTQNGRTIQISNTEFVSDSLTDILTLTTAEELEIGNHQFNISYFGRMRTEDDMNGFYRSSYVNKDNIKRNLGTTQMQPTHARKVFPCFDEPSYKAEFDISITHPKQYTAVGNTPASRYEDTTSATTTFATTPKMSTYLIAFVVSDFTCSSNSLEDGTPHSICSTEESKDIRNLALDFGVDLAEAMETFTGVKYDAHKITKIHQFAIPDFSAGAMENWGLVTYRERYLLWDPQESSNRYKQHVITIIAHELSHFWFGNLVTCNWWSNTFLNEGFATYFEYHLPQQVNSTLQTDKQFVIEAHHTALSSDASPSSAPLSSPASSQSQISGRFSTVSYSKGGSVFRMVQHIMGLDAFKQGLNKYITDNQFKNTVPEDLWAALQNFAPAGLPSTLADIMHRWVYYGGYPVLNVSATGTQVTISQRRFLSSGQASVNEKWYVPVSYTTSSDDNKFESTTPRVWLRPELNINSPLLQNADDWIILNNQQAGYYRVDYDKNLWEKIKTALNKPNFDGIHELNRAQIVNDFFNFVRYDYYSFSELLDLYSFLKNDTSYYAWYSAFSAFSTMTSRTTNQKVQDSLSAHILDLAENFYKSVPFNTDKSDDQIFTLSKVLIVPWACRLKHKDCVDNALAAFEDFRTNQKKPDKNLISVVYCNGLRHSTNIARDWNHLWEEYQKTPLSDEKVTILSALGCTTDEETLTNFLYKGIDGNSGVRPQDTTYVFSAVYGGNPEGVDAVLNFIIKNHTQIATHSASTLATLLSNVGSRITRKEQADQLETLVNSGALVASVQSTAASALATARYNLVWTESFEEEMRVYFSIIESGASSLTVGVSTIVMAVLVVFYQI